MRGSSRCAQDLECETKISSGYDKVGDVRRSYDYRVGIFRLKMFSNFDSPHSLQCIFS